MQLGASRSAAVFALEKAIDGLKQSITNADVVEFQSTTIEELWIAIRDIEQAQRDHKYSKVIEVCCNGTPYMPWIWAPIKLLLQLASGYQNIFEKLLQAYARIAEALPQFDRFRTSFKGNAAFEAVLAMVFTDIAEFHRRAYKFFRRRAWHIFFHSCWKNFDARFDTIIQSLERHRDLVEREALSIDMVEAREWREKTEADLEERERRERVVQLQGAIAWLAVEGSQEDDLDRLLQTVSPGTSEWIITHPKVKTWMEDDESEPITWLRGIPGSGKSILCARLIQYLQDATEIPTLYFFCSGYITSKNLCSEIFRTLISQLLRLNPELSLHIYDDFIQKGCQISMVQLRVLLPQLLLSIASSRIIIDGLDECDQADQKSALLELFKMTGLAETSCKLFLSCRSNVSAPRSLKRMPLVCLSTVQSFLESDIRIYVKAALVEIQEEDRFHGHDLDDIEEAVMSKTKGMFLWAKLVMDELKLRQCVNDLRDGAKNLPDGLQEAYGNVLQRLKTDLREYQRDQAMRILEWVACSYRPLRLYELQDGVCFRKGNTILNKHTKLPPSIIDVCRPLLQVGPNGIVNFVHFSAREFLLSEQSGPFINELQAHYNIAFSCASYLATSLCLASSTIDIKERQDRILKGFHGLHHYSHAFWIEHLLQYANSLDSQKSNDDQSLTAQVRHLLAFKKTDWISKVQEIALKRENESEEISSRALILSSDSDIHEFVPAVLAFQRALFQKHRVQRSQKDLREYKLEHDPTYFSEVLQFYQTTLELFLQPLEVPQLSSFDKDLLYRFQSTHRHTAYVCRYRLCPRTCDGFSSPLEREEHEATHINHLKCRDPSCPSASTAFPSQLALQKHKKLAHPLVEKPIPPLRLPPSFSGTSPEMLPESPTGQDTLPSDMEAA